MDYMLQIHGAKYVVPIPNGLNEILSDISREVLRAQPEDIYRFVANYLTACNKTRDVCKLSMSMIGETYDSGTYQAQLFREIGITLEEADRAATVIQSAWRGYQVRKSLTKLDQTSLTVDGFDLMALLSEKGISYETAEEAAILIQSTFRGYLARKTYTVTASVPSHEEWRHDWLFEEFGITPEQYQERKKQDMSAVSFINLPRRTLKLDDIKIKTLLDPSSLHSLDGTASGSALLGRSSFTHEDEEMVIYYKPMAELKELYSNLHSEFYGVLKPPSEDGAGKSSSETVSVTDDEKAAPGEGYEGVFDLTGQEKDFFAGANMEWQDDLEGGLKEEVKGVSSVETETEPMDDAGDEPPKTDVQS